MKRRTITAATVALLAGGLLAGCGGAGGITTGSSKTTINVLAINPNQMLNLEKLTAQYFTAKTGIAVHYTLLPENDLRTKMNQEFSTQAGQYDVASVSAYEIPFYSKNGWLAPLNSYLANDPGFDENDIFPNLRAATTGADGKIYAEPFFGEGSFMMYRKDIFAKAGVTMPADPTWQQIAALAAKVNGIDGASGICLRGLAGWGQNLAPLTTVVNTFGGQWFNDKWQAQLTSPGFVAATSFYVHLLQKYGEPGAAQSGVLEILNEFVQGKCAMMYDASSLASTIEAANSPVRGKVGFVAAPHYKTQDAGWLWTWAWGIEAASKNKAAAWKFIAWASSKEYQDLVGSKLGWVQVPGGSRQSLYQNPNYQKAAEAFYQQEYNAVLHSASPRQPSVDPQPYSGVQFVGIPEFAQLGTQVAEQIASAIAGQISVSQALGSSQQLAEAVGKKYQAP